jgi:hypothetical protein
MRVRYLAEQIEQPADTQRDISPFIVTRQVLSDSLT